jgi:hypothetical protein
VTECEDKRLVERTVMFGIASHMPRHREFWYSVIEDGTDEYPAPRYSAKSVFYDAGDRSTDAVEDYYNNHDGWEARWPKTFAIYETEDGPEVGRFTVSMEAVPQFDASPVQAQGSTD